MKKIIALFFVLLSCGAYSNTPERKHLSVLLKELEKLEYVIHMARTSSVPEEKFQYTKLEADLSKIKQGLKKYIDEPRRLPVLPGNYDEPINGSYGNE